MSNQCFPSCSHRCRMGTHAQSKSLGPLVPSPVVVSLPILGMEQERLYRAHFDIRASGVCMDANRLVTSHGEHMEVAMIGEPGTQVQVVPIDGISHDPRDGDLCLVDALNHLSSQLAFRLETNRFRNACLAAPLAIVNPFLGKIECAIDEGMYQRDGIVQRHDDLTVLDLLGCSAILHGDTC